MSTSTCTPYSLDKGNGVIINSNQGIVNSMYGILRLPNPSTLHLPRPGAGRSEHARDCVPSLLLMACVGKMSDLPSSEPPLKKPKTFGDSTSDEHLRLVEDAVPRNTKNAAAFWIWQFEDYFKAKTGDVLGLGYMSKTYSCFFPAYLLTM